MLDALIIDEIRRREEERRRGLERPVVELPLDPPELDWDERDVEESEPPRVIIIDL